MGCCGGRKHKWWYQIASLNHFADRRPPNYMLEHFGKMFLFLHAERGGRQTNNLCIVKALCQLDILIRQNTMGLVYYDDPKFACLFVFGPIQTLKLFFAEKSLNTRDLDRGAEVFFIFRLYKPKFNLVNTTTDQRILCLTNQRALVNDKHTSLSSVQVVFYYMCPNNSLPATSWQICQGILIVRHNFCNHFILIITEDRLTACCLFRLLANFIFTQFVIFTGIGNITKDFISSTTTFPLRC
mmetsp:Transcript_42328/g.67847  ORF Transcript_42328/g.67847 Transcript_42328/m.67847 type:complete len:241 (+) Transcript_42328:4021-4743(+)